MKNPIFNLKTVQTGSYKAEVGARASSGVKTFWKLESELEPKQMISAPQHCCTGTYFVPQLCKAVMALHNNLFQIRPKPYRNFLIHSKSGSSTIFYIHSH
jgi:hypothetical protein